MKNYIIFIFVILGFVFAKSQVGIGTQSPANSSVLDIVSTNKGLLIPRVELSSTTSSSPLTGTLTNGTMVFNTATAGTGSTSVIPSVYIWYNNEWVIPGNLGQPVVKAVQFKNKTTSTTNFTASTLGGNVQIDIFGDQVFNDDTALFEKINDNQLRITQAGLYVVTLNLALRENPQTQNSTLEDYIHFNLDGVLVSTNLATVPMQTRPDRVNLNGRFDFGFKSYINANANQILTLESTRQGSGNAVIFDSSSLSSVTIVKLK